MGTFRTTHLCAHHAFAFSSSVPALVFHVQLPAILGCDFSASRGTRGRADGMIAVNMFGARLVCFAPFGNFVQN
jgi:hypothetical protein